MKKKKIKLCLTKQLLNIFKLWCEWGIRQKNVKKKKTKKTKQNKTKQNKNKENDGKIWVIRMMAKIRPP